MMVNISPSPEGVPRLDRPGICKAPCQLLLTLSMVLKDSSMRSRELTRKPVKDRPPSLERSVPDNDLEKAGHLAVCRAEQNEGFFLSRNAPLFFPFKLRPLQKSSTWFSGPFSLRRCQKVSLHHEARLPFAMAFLNSQPKRLNTGLADVHSEAPCRFL